MTYCRHTNKFATSTMPLAASLYPLSYGPTVRRKLRACEATDYLLQHLATEHAQLQSAITGQCVPHYHLTETATGAHRMVTTSYLHIRYLPGTITLDLCIWLDSNCATTLTYKRWPMCSNNIADGAQHAHSVPNTYVHHIAHTTAHTPCTVTVSVSH